MTNGINDEREKKLRESSLAFFGAITASVSHELNNVISIIDQTAGLLGDLLAGAQHGRPLSEEQLERIAVKVKNQTERGVKIIKRLNTFAHSTDEPVREFEVNQLVENLTALTERLAGLKGVNLHAQYLDQPYKLVNNPFVLQQTLFLIIKKLLTRAEKNDSVTVAVSRRESGVGVTITGPAKTAPEPEHPENLELLVESLRGTWSVTAEGDKTIYEITIPGIKYQ
jgi:C4-dicarboxylate-specific signal transduction histidine kinase